MSPKFSSDVKGETPQFQYNVVVAIDFGTTFSGYAYSFTHDPENIHIMRKWEGNHATSRNNLLLLRWNRQTFGTSNRDVTNFLRSINPTDLWNP